MLLSLTSAPGNMMDQILLETFSRCMKCKVTANSQQEFTKCKLCLINLTVFCDEVTGVVDKGKGR